MAFYTRKDSDTNFYQAPAPIATLQGICPTNRPNEFVITGTNTAAVGVVYKGPIDIANNTLVHDVVYPNSTSTSAYGPEYLHNKYHPEEDRVNIVGSYQTGTVGLNEPCVGFVYSGLYGDFANPANYSTIAPVVPTKFTVVHSTRGGLAVYISSDESQGDFAIGKSYVYDLDKKATISEVVFPGAAITTTYGIWHNKHSNIRHFDHYTIGGGFSASGLPTDTRIFVVDLYYNKVTGELHFDGWSQINIPGITLFSHAQGLSGLTPDEYVLPVANYTLDPVDPTKLVQISGGKIQVRRINGVFILVGYETIVFPQSKFCIVTSAAKNAVVGVCVSANDDLFSFTAETATHKHHDHKHHHHKDNCDCGRGCDCNC